jgi:hypothetical protein
MNPLNRQDIDAPVASVQPGAQDTGVQSAAAPGGPSTSLHHAPEALPAKPLHLQIGLMPAGKLAAEFGSLQPPRHKRGVPTIHRWERAGNEPDGRPITHPGRIELPDGGDALSADAESQLRIAAHAMRHEGKKYIWTVDEMGRVLIGDEIDTGIANPKHPGETYSVGHPALVGGGDARISGEMACDQATNRLLVSNLSGRYSRYADRKRPHAEAAYRIIASAFARVGLLSQLRYEEPEEGKKEALIIRSDDPNRWREEEEEQGRPLRTGAGEPP